MSTNQRKKWIECTCTSPEHVLLLRFFTDEKEKYDHSLYVDVYLQMPKWYKRIWRAIKYIFGYRSRYGDFTEIVYDIERVKELKAFLDAYCEAAPKAESKNV